jgi:hypothetical protein
MPNLEIMITAHVTEALNIKTSDIPNSFHAHNPDSTLKGSNKNDQKKHHESAREYGRTT